MRLRRYKTACCSRLSRPQAGTALVVPESALTFIYSPPSGALIIPCLLPIKRIPYFFSNESSEERNESSPFQWIFRRRVIQVPLWGSKDPGRCSVLVQPVPVQSTCVSTSLRGRGHRLHSITEWCCDSFLCPGEMLLVLGWLNYLPSFTGNMLSMLKKNKNSRSSSEMWPMPLNSPQPL